MLPIYEKDPSTDTVSYNPVRPIFEKDSIIDTASYTRASYSPKNTVIVCYIHVSFTFSLQFSSKLLRRFGTKMRP